MKMTCLFFLRWTELPDIETGRLHRAAAYVPGLGDIVIGGLFSFSSIRSSELLEMTEQNNTKVYFWKELDPMLKSKFFKCCHRKFW